MAIFTIISQVEDNEALEAAIAREYRTENIKISPSCWLISASGTAKEVGGRLRVMSDGKGDVDDVLIFNASGSYWGHAQVEIWEWLSSKLAAS